MHRTVLLLAVIATVPIIAESPKEPWQFTLEERIALRTDPELARERIRRDTDRRVQTSSTPSASSRARSWVDSFNGKTHPELFLPHEVFDQLIRLAFLGPPRMGQVVHQGFLPDIKRTGLPADFWERLQSVSAVYLADSWALRDIGAGIQQQSGAARRRAEQESALKAEDACRSRAEALAAARREFVRERFDRFLYEVIARGMFHADDRLSDPEQLQKAEEGCSMRFETTSS